MDSDKELLIATMIAALIFLFAIGLAIYQIHEISEFCKSYGYKLNDQFDKCINQDGEYFLFDSDSEGNLIKLKGGADQ